MINQHPENDPPHDDNRVDDGVAPTVDRGVEDHREGMMAERLGDGLLNAADDRGATLSQPCPASGNAVLNDQTEIVGASMGERLGQAGKALADGDTDHHQHGPAIKARRASLLNAGNDEANVSRAVSNAGHLSGLEIIGVESPRNNPLAHQSSPESSDQNHLSGTMSSFANVRANGDFSRRT